MFLKRLETVGFKSFAERVKVQFVPGVTAVVGPNGSGKSNIIDAIRWVLGEQSARALRGKKMEDIIFQGSETRNALNFAEVSIILNNEDEELPIDYHEVNITRRVYRSGESEFFINKQSCRLKDIVDLFMDTGLGRESFSIIGQGKIEEILSSKAEERRAIFEEAAGVLKYKQRKNKAQFKLDETAHNLERVEDIIYEIEKQMEPLKKQAEIAKQYKVKKEQLKEIEIALLVTEIEELHHEWKTILKKIEADQLIEVEKKTTIQKKEAQLSKNRKEVEELEQEITQLQHELLHITEQLEQGEGKRNVLQERVKHLEENKQKLHRDKEVIQNRIEETKQLRDVEEKKLLAVKEKIEQVTKEIKVLEKKLFHGLDAVKEELEDLKSDYIEYLNEQAVLQNEQQLVTKQLEQSDSTYKAHFSKHQSVQEREETLKSSLEKVTQQVSLSREKKEKIEAEIVQLNDHIEEAKSQYESMQKQLYEGNEQIAKIASRKEMLEEMKESFQGFFYGVKEILRASRDQQLHRVHGAVIDLIKVPEQYITAIDTILGAQAQYIVVPDDEVARSIIHWLKRENKGRATFLPLQSIESRTLPASIFHQIKQQSGFIGIASNLVKTEKTFRIVAQHLMGNVIVANTLEDANNMARMTNRRYRVVTLEGDVVFPGGSMSGGAKKKSKQTLFTREKEITTLTKKLNQFVERRKLFMEKMDEQTKKITQFEKEVTHKEKLLQETNQILQEEQEKYNHISNDLRTVNDELTSYQINKEQQDELRTHLQKEREQIATKLSKVNVKIKNTEQSIERLTEEQHVVQENEKMTEQRLHELQVIIAEQEERKKHHVERMNQLDLQLKEESEELEKIAKQMNELITFEESDEQAQQLTKDIAIFKNKRQAIQSTLEEKRSLRQQKGQYIEDEEREIRQLYKLHESFVQHIQEKEVQANRLDVTLENQLSFLQTEYVITYEKAVQQYSKVKHIEKAKKQVQEMKQSIERLGTVNLGSIKAYDRLMERYTFLSEQQQDLIDAKTTLYQVILEMDEEMTERFSSMFTDIQAAFTIVFKQLFGGGYAELTLTDPDNMLETGIEIIARPPGKKLRTLDLLSGGERALTAIALLFAILKARPVPFCILDEVDAALDEANVVRFGDYLKRFSEETQFIVITHRKGTMEKVDALYGVTMQESGVSRLVSVKLEQTTDLVEAT